MSLEGRTRNVVESSVYKKRLTITYKYMNTLQTSARRGKIDQVI